MLFLRVVLVVVVALTLMLVTAVPSFAMTMEPGLEFGQHVYEMAAVEQHPLTHGGQHFGGCVSTMATGGACQMNEGG